MGFERFCYLGRTLQTITAIVQYIRPDRSIISHAGFSSALQNSSYLDFYIHKAVIFEKSAYYFYTAHIEAREVMLV